jgi:photosystem II stability/assembly factor-like uncharacterized protein
MEELQDYVYCLAASPNFKQDGMLFAAKQSGLYRSSDAGRTWKNAYASLNLPGALPTTWVAVAAARQDTYVFASVEGKVLRSLDSGETWQAADLESPAPQITALAISPNFAEDGTLLAASMQDGIFCSTDRGATWTGWNFGLYDANINALAFADAQTVLCGTQSGVFTSTNAGRSWCDTDFPLERAPVLCLAVSSGKAIFAGTEAQGLLVSQDEGKTWEQILAGGVEQILPGPNGKMLVLRDEEVLFSDNDGKTWQPRARGEKGATLSALLAPLGLDATGPLLGGLINGEVVTL